MKIEEKAKMLDELDGKELELSALANELRIINPSKHYNLLEKLAQVKREKAKYMPKSVTEAKMLGSLRY